MIARFIVAPLKFFRFHRNAISHTVPIVETAKTVLKKENQDHIYIEMIYTADMRYRY